MAKWERELLERERSNSDAGIPPADSTSLHHAVRRQQEHGVLWKKAVTK